MVVQCCVCRKVRHQSGQWNHDVPPAHITPEASHAYCPPCADAAFAEIRRRVEARGPLALDPA